MDLLYFFESIRTPFLNVVMQLITELGGETVFLAAAIILFWCVDKKEGYYMMTVGFAGIIVNQFLKLWFRIPRPWVKDPGFTIVESAGPRPRGIPSPAATRKTCSPPWARPRGTPSGTGSGRCWCWVSA